MPVIDRTLWFNGLIDDDGSGVVGTVWQKSEVGRFIDSIDAALAGQFTPALHAGVHMAGGLDAIRLDQLAAPVDVLTLNVSTTAHGLTPKLPGNTTTFLRGDGQWASSNSLHAGTHEAGGIDALKLDNLAAPDDNTDLNATTTAHGLAPKLPGGTSTFLRGDGTYAIPSGITPAAHAATHGSGGTDPIAIAESQVINLTTDLTAIATNKADKTDPRFTDSRVPTLHAASHKSGGGDVIKLDELGAATDVTTLNATTFAHGLLPKLPGGATTFLRGDGTFAAPTATAGAHATTHQNGGSDPVDVGTLAGFPGNTTAFLRADGQFVVPPNGSSGGGNVTGPVSSVVGHLASFNNATGTLIADAGIALTAVVQTTDPRLTDARTPTVHAPSHAAGGSDPVTIAESQVTNLVADLAGKASTTDPRFTDARTPTAHAPTHKSGGTDAIKLDELAAPTDVTTLNVSTTAHGLTPKLPGNTTTFLRGDGTYTVPPGTGVVGPASATDTAIVRFDGTTGKLVQNSLVTIDSSGTINAGGVKVTGTGPSLVFNDTDQPANQHQFRILFDSDKLSWQTLNDSGGVLLTLLEANRTTGDVGIGSQDVYVTRDLYVGGTVKAGSLTTQQTTGATGTQNNFSLTAAQVVLRCNGASPLVLTGFNVAGGTVPAGASVRVQNAGSSTIRVAAEDTGSTAAYRIIGESLRGQIIGPNGSVTLMYDGVSTRWRIVAVNPGAAIPVPYSGGNFTGFDAGSVWTVDAGDVSAFTFKQNGTTFMVFITIATSSVSGNPTSGFNVALPNGFTVGNNGVQVGMYGRLLVSAVWKTGMFLANSTAPTVVTLFPLDQVTVPAITDGFYLQGQAQFLVD